MRESNALYYREQRALRAGARSRRGAALHQGTRGRDGIPLERRPDLVALQLTGALPDRRQAQGQQVPCGRQDVRTAEPRPRPHLRFPARRERGGPHRLLALLDGGIARALSVEIRAPGGLRTPRETGQGHLDGAQPRRPRDDLLNRRTRRLPLPDRARGSILRLLPRVQP